MKVLIKKSKRPIERSLGVDIFQFSVSFDGGYGYWYTGSREGIDQLISMLSLTAEVLVEEID